MMKELRREDVISDLVWLRLMNAFLSITYFFWVFLSYFLVMMTFNVILLSCSFRLVLENGIGWIRFSL